VAGSRAGSSRLPWAGQGWGRAWLWLVWFVSFWKPLKCRQRGAGSHARANQLPREPGRSWAHGRLFPSPSKHGATSAAKRSPHRCPWGRPTQPPSSDPGPAHQHGPCSAPSTAPQFTPSTANQQGPCAAPVQPPGSVPALGHLASPCPTSSLQGLEGRAQPVRCPAQGDGVSSVMAATQQLCAVPSAVPGAWGHPAQPGSATPNSSSQQGSTGKAAETPIHPVSTHHDAVAQATPWGTAHPCRTPQSGAWEGGWVTGMVWPRRPFLSQPAPRDCPRLIHALDSNCYLHSGTEFAELGQEGGGTGPTGAPAGPGRRRALRLPGKGLEAAGSPDPGWKRLPRWGGRWVQQSRRSGNGRTQWKLAAGELRARRQAGSGR